jgi:hypothetical protein
VTAPSTSVPRHAARHRFPRHSTQWIVLASIAGVLGLGYFGTVVVGLLPDRPKAQVADAAWAPTVSATPPSGNTSAADPSATATASRPSPTSSRLPRTTSRPSPTPSTQAPTSTEICRLAEHGGTFYLSVSSSAEHSFNACGRGTPYAGTTDQLLSSGSGMDRRCTLDPGHTAQSDTVVVVYSDTAQADLTAARAFCNASQGDD